MPRPSVCVLLAFSLAMSVQTGCVAARVTATTADAAVFVGKTTVRGAVGAGTLAARGTGAAVRLLRSDTAEFPAGTPVCADGAGGYTAADTGADGLSYCPE